MSTESGADLQRPPCAGRAVEGTGRAAGSTELRPPSGQGAERASHEEPTVLTAAL